MPDLLDEREFSIDGVNFSFEALSSNKFIKLDSLQSELRALPELADWDTHVAMSPPLSISGLVVKGFGRGSK